jgi:TonB family protein
MNALPKIHGGWTRGRFWRVAGVLCIAQATLILLFAEREQSPFRTVSPPADFRLLGRPLSAGQLTKTFFAIDPTVFPLPSRHGFSGRAWLRLPAPQFETPGETETPAWLTLDAARLGIDFPQFNRSKSVLAFGLADQAGPELEPWPVFLTPEVARTHSFFEIGGELAGRQLNAPGELPAETNGQLLANSVVQIAVDSAGQVVAARLLERSGSAGADSSALATARHLRFRPVASPTPVWGSAVSEWQTVEPTNADVTGAP